MTETTIGAPGEAGLDWASLRSYSGREWETGAVAFQVLEQLRKEAGAEATAVYVGTDEGDWRRVVGVGCDSLPVRVERRPIDGVVTRELPGGLHLVVVEPQRDFELAPSVASLLGATSRLRLLNERLKRQSFQEGLKVVKLEALYDVGLAIASTLNLDQLTEGILMHAVALLDARRGALYLAEGDEFRCHRSIGGDALERVPIDWSAESEILLPGARHQLVLPIESEDGPRGLLVMADKESRTGVGPFTDDDRRSLNLFASQASIALENARLHRQALEKERLEREMELAAEIQRGLLPSGLPSIPGFDVLGWNRPTRQVGGDYFACFPLQDGRFGIVVADVTGKGIPAALLVSTLHSALKLLLDHCETEEELLRRLNEHVHEASGANKFITLFLALVSPGSDDLRFLNAGHNPGMLVRRDGSVELLPASGVPLGLIEGTSYRQSDSRIAAGDLLCLYSDGITECESPQDEQYGEERLATFLAEHRREPLPSILEALDREVQEFVGDRPQGDDQTVVLLRRKQTDAGAAD